MRIVIQRVSEASVTVNQKIVGQINLGLLVLVGFEETDNQEDFLWIANKIINLRIFNDENGVMNLSLQEINGKILVVSQFTLHAQTKKGNRPSYIKASRPELAMNQYNQFLEILENSFAKKVEKGIFCADMKVLLLNDGPVTIFMDSRDKQ